MNYINHVLFVLDASGSMLGLKNDVVKVFDNQIKHLAKRSKEMDQETRVTVFQFGSKSECLIYDMDVLREPSIKNLYKPNYNWRTALIDATIDSVTEINLTRQVYGDHAFLTYIVTDGEENESIKLAYHLTNFLQKLPNNNTIGVMVPDERGVEKAKVFGFSPDNIAIWDTTSKGLLVVGSTIRNSTETFMINRSKGIRSTKTLFAKADTSNLTTEKVATKLEYLSRNEYEIFDIAKDGPICEMVMKLTGRAYETGMSYYQLTKPEDIQSYKKIIIRMKVNGNVYVGDKARTMIKIPANTNVRVHPVKFGEFDIFVQSTSINRKLIKGTKVIVMR